MKWTDSTHAKQVSSPMPGIDIAEEKHGLSETEKEFVANFLHGRMFVVLLGRIILY